MIATGEQRLQAGRLPRHRHAGAYAAIVLDGGYFEAGDAGRWHVAAGDVVAHRAFEAHGNAIASSGAIVLNLALPLRIGLPPVFRVADADGLIAAARAGEHALGDLLAPVEVREPAMLDWPDQLARALRQGPVRIGRWAAEHGLAPATISRGFRAAFGTTAARYRAEAQTRAALQAIVADGAPLAAIAYGCGFADQAHLCRAILQLTGRTPSDWRRIKTVQDRTPPEA